MQSKQPKEQQEMLRSPERRKKKALLMKKTLVLPVEILLAHPQAAAKEAGPGTRPGQWLLLQIERDLPEPVKLTVKTMPSYALKNQEQPSKKRPKSQRASAELLAEKHQLPTPASPEATSPRRMHLELTLPNQKEEDQDNNLQKSHQLAHQEQQLLPASVDSEIPMLQAEVVEQIKKDQQQEEADRKSVV